MAGFQLIDAGLFERVLDQARQSPRRRMNFNFHSSPEDNAHRFLNVMLEGTYIRPHRHITPPKAEAFLVLEGRVALFLFDDNGNITAGHALGGPAGPVGIDIGAGEWHGLAVLSPHAVTYEVKPGPYSAVSDKHFAPWAPPEGDPGVPGFLTKLRSFAG
jgi:cupin fold WbuC family metalloprotein